jgi:hypothetical protein
MTFRRGAFVVLAAALLTVVAANAATAAQPIRSPLFAEDFSSDQLCSFPVLIEVTANKEFVTEFSDGRLLITGKFFVRVTNLDTGESLDLNASGPAMFAPERAFLRGRTLFLLFPTDPDGPGLLLTSGSLQLIAAEDGSLAGFNLTGRSLDVCAALA